MKIDQKSSRLMVVPDQIAHQNIEDVIVDRDRFTEARHPGE